MKNESGIFPVEYKVLIQMRKVEKVSAGGIILPDQTVEKDSFERAEGVVVAFGSIAFTDPNWGEGAPKVGDRVMIDKYAGCFVQGKDGAEYKIISDKEIGAIVRS